MHTTKSKVLKVRPTNTLYSVNQSAWRRVRACPSFTGTRPRSRLLPSPLGVRVICAPTGGGNPPAIELTTEVGVCMCLAAAIC